MLLSSLSPISLLFASLSPKTQPSCPQIPNLLVHTKFFRMVHQLICHFQNEGVNTYKIIMRIEIITNKSIL